MAAAPVTRQDPDTFGVFHDSGLAAQAEKIREAIGRLDEATHAAADRIREAEKRYLAGTLEQADASAIYDEACAVAPHAPDVVRMLSNLDYLPYRVQNAIPELVNDTNIARIRGVLRLIGEELDNYLADSDAVHLTNALETGLQNLHNAVHRSFGYWQIGRNPGPVAADLDFSAERRGKLTGQLQAALQRWVPGSRAQIRGPLDSGPADDYASIGICWVVPDQDFTDAADSLGAALSQVSAVLSIHDDPQLARPARRRISAARLSRAPLFWRIDIDIRASSAAADDLHDADSPGARGQAGNSAASSAIENAIAAAKAAARGQADTAQILLRRGCEIIGHDPGSTADLADAIISLANACASQEPRLARTAAEIHQVADHLLRPDRPAHR